MPSRHAALTAFLTGVQFLTDCVRMCCVTLTGDSFRQIALGCAAWPAPPDPAPNEQERVSKRGRTPLSRLQGAGGRKLGPSGYLHTRITRPWRS